VPKSAADVCLGSCPARKFSEFARLLFGPAKNNCCVPGVFRLTTPPSKVSIGRFGAAEFPKFTFPDNFSEGFQPSNQQSSL
jgi:hypothetical protein